ncbi:MAG: GAF domain-containing protein, partial [Octadecabacter sp.]
MSDTKQARPADALPFSLIDPDRLDALARSGMMDSQTEEVFDRATRLASQITGRPVALLSLVDDTRQYFKAQVGLRGQVAQERGTALSHSFCQHVVSQNEPLNVHDARDDPRVKNNSAIEDLGVIAYYGVPVRDADGYVLGSFCAIDNKPHSWSNDEIAALHDLGAIVETELRLQQSLRDNQMLVGELNHRIKNIFTVTSSLVRMTARSVDTADEMATVLGERLRALDAAQSLAIAQSLQDGGAEASVELTELFETVMKPYNAD